MWSNNIFTTGMNNKHNKEQGNNNERYGYLNLDQNQSPLCNLKTDRLVPHLQNPRT